MSRSVVKSSFAAAIVLMFCVMWVAAGEKPVPFEEDILTAPKVLFIQQDVVTSFPPTGDGLRLGTVRGALTGISTTNFQFIPKTPTEFTSDELSLYTDANGDQVLFHVKLDGRFVTPLSGTPDPNFPGRDQLNLVNGTFGGTYEVIQATGQYLGLVGRKFPARGLAVTPVKNPAIGVSYMEIFSDTFEF